MNAHAPATALVGLVTTLLCAAMLPAPYAVLIGFLAAAAFVHLVRELRAD